MGKKALYLIYLLVVLEVFLRAQQFFGPLYDLNPHVDPSVLSDRVNHQHPESEIYDEFGTHKIPKEPEKSDEKLFRVLFMGDSFMEGLSPQDSIPAYIWDYFKGFREKNVQFVNAGHSSYSPLIFIAQFKMIYPVYEPDLVIINIDETDFGDDYVRYKHLAVRDHAGRVIAVQKTPLNAAWYEGLKKINTMPSYIMRFIYKLWFTRIEIFSIEKKYRDETDNRHVLEFGWNPERRDPGAYAHEKKFFRENLSELIETMIRLMGSAERIVFVYHPHRFHFQEDPERGVLWESQVRPILKEVTEQYGIYLYDFTDDLLKLSEGDVTPYYFEYDMHFNAKGLKAYAHSLAADLEARQIL